MSGATEAVDPCTARSASHADTLRSTDYATMSRRLGLNLDEAMPHVEAMLGRLRRDRPYTEEPSLIFRYADSDAAEEANDV